MDHPFQVGEQYTNRKGTYRVLEITPTTMRVEYEHGGGSELLDIAVQVRIQQNMQRERSAPPPPPPPAPRRPATPRVARASTATATTPATAKATTPRTTKPRTRTAPASRATLREVAGVQWPAVREAGRDSRAQLLRAALEDRDLFVGLVEGAIEGDRGRYWLSPLAEVQQLNSVEPVSRTDQPELLLAHSIAGDRGHLATPDQRVLARQYPIHETGTIPYRVELLGYEAEAGRPLVCAVRVRATAVQWLWEALFSALDTWIVLRATAAGLPASLGEEYPLNAPPGLGIIAPRAYWQENEAGRSAASRSAEALSRSLVTAIRAWLNVPVHLLEVDDDWLRRVDTPGQPAVRPATW